MEPGCTYQSSKVDDRILLMGMAVVAMLALVAIFAVLLTSWHYAAIICGSVVFLVASLLWPEWGTYSLIFLVPFTTASVYFHMKADWNFIVGRMSIDLIPVFAMVVFMTFAGSVLRRLGKVEKGASGKMIAKPLFVVFAYSGLTVFWSDSFCHSMFQFLTFAMNVIIFGLITTYVRDESDLAAAVWCFIASGIVQALSYVICFFLDTYIFNFKMFPDFFFVLNIVGGYFQPSGMPLTDGGFMDHHQLALLVNLVLAVSLGLLLTQPSRLKKTFLIVNMTIFVFIVLHTQSRAGIGSLLVMGCFAFFAFHATRKYFFRISLSFVVGVVGLYFIEASVTGLITGKYTTPRLLALGQKMQTTKNVIDPGLKEKTGRMRLWEKSFEKYKDYALEGFGVGNLKKLMNAPHAHNIFFSFLFDFGIIGLACAIFIVGALVKRFHLLLHYQSSYSLIMSVAFGVGLVAVGFHGQFDFEYNTTLLWLYLGLTVASFRIAYEGIRRSDAEGIPYPRPSQAATRSN